jgi:hypothetical protein
VIAKVNDGVNMYLVYWRLPVVITLRLIIFIIPFYVQDSGSLRIQHNECPSPHGALHQGCRRRHEEAVSNPQIS